MSPIQQSKSQLHPEGFVRHVFYNRLVDSPLSMRCIVARTDAFMKSQLLYWPWSRCCFACLYRYGFLDGKPHTLEETAIQDGEIIPWDTVCRERIGQIVKKGMRFVESRQRRILEL